MLPVTEVPDPYAHWLQSLRLRGVFYCQALLSGRWSLHIPAQPGCATFHLAQREPYWLELDGKLERVRAGEFVLVPQGRAHVLWSEPRRRSEPVSIDALPYERVSEHYRVLRHGDGGDVSELMCGVIRFEHPIAQGLVAPLPRLLRLAVRAEGAEARRLAATAWMIGEEARASLPGADTLVSRLIDALAVRAIRDFIAKDPRAARGWLSALQDRQIGRALAALHEQPARAWSVVELARLAGMSRAGFSARFHELVGEPPMQHLTRFRIELAYLWLREESWTLAQIATRLGYSSEAALGRSFKRLTGISPGAIRRPPRSNGRSA